MWVESIIKLISAEAEALLGLAELGNIYLFLHELLDKLFYIHKAGT